jgi:hypothetical protein
MMFVLENISEVIFICMGENRPWIKFPNIQTCTIMHTLSYSTSKLADSKQENLLQFQTQMRNFADGVTYYALPCIN